MRWVSIHELQGLRIESPDWGTLLRELSAKGVSGNTVAELLERDTTTMDNWRNRGRQPKYAEGATIIALHRHFCGEGR